MHNNTLVHDTSQNIANKSKSPIPPLTEGLFKNMHPCRPSNFIKTEFDKILYSSPSKEIPWLRHSLGHYSDRLAANPLISRLVNPHSNTQYNFLSNYYK